MSLYIVWCGVEISKGINNKGGQKFDNPNFELSCCLITTDETHYTTLRYYLVIRMWRSHGRPLKKIKVQPYRSRLKAEPNIVWENGS